MDQLCWIGLLFRQDGVKIQWRGCTDRTYWCTNWKKGSQAATYLSQRFDLMFWWSNQTGRLALASAGTPWQSIWMEAPRPLSQGCLETWWVGRLGGIKLHLKCWTLPCSTRMCSGLMDWCTMYIRSLFAWTESIRWFCSLVGRQRRFWNVEICHQGFQAGNWRNEAMNGEVKQNWP